MSTRLTDEQYETLKDLYEFVLKVHPEGCDIDNLTKEEATELIEKVFQELDDQ